MRDPKITTVFFVRDAAGSHFFCPLLRSRVALRCVQRLLCNPVARRVIVGRPVPWPLLLRRCFSPGPASAASGAAPAPSALRSGQPDGWKAREAERAAAVPPCPP